MGKAFDIGLERLTGTSVPGLTGDPERAQDLEIVRAGGAAVLAASYEETRERRREAGVSATTEPEKDRGTFYLETFGCQMNEHDSEKVAGLLLARGYKQVERLDAADVILYNTCSIREKAAQKVFSRLGELRPADWTGKNRRFGEQTIGGESPGQKDSATTAEPALSSPRKTECGPDGTEESSGGLPRRMTEEGAALKDSPSDRSNDRRLQTKSGETGGSLNRRLENRSQNSARGLVKRGLPIIGVLGCLAQQEGHEIF